MKTILLTGATGFLGSHILDRLLKGNYQVVILKRSFSDLRKIEENIDKCRFYDIDKCSLELPFKENHIDCIIHAATNYGRNNNKTSDIVNDNLIFPLKLLEVASFFNTDTLQYKYLTNYTLSKKQFVEWGKSFANAGKIKFINLMLEHMYGPKDDESKFVTWIIKQLANNVPEVKLTDGNQKRDFIYVDDVVEAYVTLLKSNFQINFDEFEIGTSQTISIKDFVLKIKGIIEQEFDRHIETHLNFGALPMREGEPSEIKANTAKIRSVGWHHHVPLDLGLKMTIESI